MKNHGIEEEKKCENDQDRKRWIIGFYH
jgi:hypothetical protein